jgi:hypothetical protein
MNGSFVVDIKEHKEEKERTRLTVGGDQIEYPGDNNDVHLIWSRKVPLVIVNHEVINIMSPIGLLVTVYKYFVTWI